MTTEIARSKPGRALYSYDLCDEMEERYGIDRREAHEGITGALSQIIDVDGQDAVVVSVRPMRPKLAEFNPGDLDIDHWVEITDETADVIREQFAAYYATRVVEDADA